MSQASITENEKRQLVNALQTHRLNTIAELRRAEKSLATIDSADVSEPMTSACASSSWIFDGVKTLTWLGTYYVNYHGLLTELRSLTRNYPFSQLISYYARYQASQPAMWGNHAPTADGVAKLASAFVSEWNHAVSQMLRYWDRPPVSH
ncbi:hypothetical protein SLS58_006374 [Diplodia intermedia]|uniref:Uncharacterized protein n=1 Tax=Diplodia intermedia TaxID=856260 RepID=A0ABR3TN63_9PEZI